VSDGTDPTPHASLFQGAALRRRTRASRLSQPLQQKAQRRLILGAWQLWRSQRVEAHRTRALVVEAKMRAVAAWRRVVGSVARTRRLTHAACAANLARLTLAFWRNWRVALRAVATRADQAKMHLLTLRRTRVLSAAVTHWHAAARLSAKDGIRLNTAGKLVARNRQRDAVRAWRQRSSKRALLRALGSALTTQQRRQLLSDAWRGWSARHAAASLRARRVAQLQRCLFSVSFSHWARRVGQQRRGLPPTHRPPLHRSQDAPRSGVQRDALATLYANTLRQRRAVRRCVGAGVCRVCARACACVSQRGGGLT
jgi:hypothetical protein